MSSTFFGLEVSRRALASQQAALNITGHNIANANTEGYTRQVGNLTTTTPYTISVAGGKMSLGSGVTLETVTRARDAYVDRQFRGETSKQQYWAGREDTLQKIEGILNEPSDNSLHTDMDNFWNAWSDLSKNPENMGARSVVRERALTLTESFHHIAQQVSDMRENLNSSINVQIHQINSYGQQIKDLNDQIKRSEVAGDNPNDLRDQRDLIVDQLSKLVSVRVVETKDPSFTDRNVNNFKVIIGNENSPENNTLVDDSTVRFLEEPPPQKLINGHTSSLVVWSDDLNPVKKEVDLGSKVGMLAANIEIRDVDLPKFGDQFDKLAQGIASAVNALHQTGQGLTAETQTDSVVGPVGINFFTNGSNPATTNPPELPVITASTITLNFIIENDLNRIATGTIPLNNETDPPTHAQDAEGNPLVTVGDGSIARALSSLSGGWSALKDLIASGKFGEIDGIPQNPVSGASFGDYYGSNVAQMGVDVQQAERMKAGQDVLVIHLSNQRESYSGVSLDEEMTNLVRFQKSYSAAARMVTMMDDMLDTIVNRMGLTR
ncbi:MAG TPA: flagellar hook-associated protein FlgK [Desulfosporosinus sp.]|nr:flagellar hook-associated protein FlgK [Desulfosporosinus sp.]